MSKKSKSKDKSNDNKLMLRGVRLAFPSLWKKATFEGDETKFEATFLVPKKDKKTKKALMKLIEDCKEQNKIKTNKVFVRDGDDPEFEDYDGYAGHWCVKAANTVRPKVLDRDKSHLTEEDGVIYSGCYVNAQISPWAQNNKWGRRINANLLGVQFVKDGEPFSGGGKTADDDDFDDLSDDYDDDDSIPF